MKQIQRNTFRKDNERLAKLESMIKNQHRLGTSENDDNYLIIKNLLTQRQVILNNYFAYTPTQVAHIERINNQLTRSTTHLVEQTAQMTVQLKAILDASHGYWEDCYLEASIQVSEGSENFIPVVEENEMELKSDYRKMAQIISEVRPIHLHTFYWDSANNVEITDRKLSMNWNIELLNVPQLSHIHYICYALHALSDHTSYSLYDIIRIKEFRNEVSVVWGSCAQ